MIDPGEQDNSDEAPTFLERRWWRWVVVGVSVLMLATFVLPILPSCNSSQPTAVAPTPDSGLVPDFTLTSAAGEEVHLYSLLEEHDAVVLVFYRGFF